MNGGHLAGKVLENARGAAVRDAPVARQPLEFHGGVAGRSEPATVARGVEGRHGPKPRTRGDPGDLEREAVGRLAARPAGARVDPRLDQSDVLVAWPRLAFRRHGGLRGTRQLAEESALFGATRLDRGAARRAFLERRVALEREVSLAVIVVVTTDAVFLKYGCDLRRVVRRRCTVGQHGCRRRQESRKKERPHVGNPPKAALVVEQELPAAEPDPEQILDGRSLILRARWGQHRDQAIAFR